MPNQTLESRIDDLYRAPLAEFVSARTALAKTLSGPDAQRVRKLAKPTVVPWAVNQVYWRARPLYDRLMKSGEQLRKAQVAALEGRKADVRAATDAHRQAIADAVRRAEEIAKADGSQPAPDALMRTFEALSLATGHDDPENPAGRLTRPVQLAGFEALTGVNVAAMTRQQEKQERVSAETKARDEQARQAEARKEEAAQKKREAEIKKAEARLAKARRQMEEAQAALKRTRDRTS